MGPVSGACAMGINYFYSPDALCVVQLTAQRHDCSLLSFCGWFRPHNEAYVLRIVAAYIVSMKFPCTYR